MAAELTTDSSYVTVLATADTYFDERLNVTVWAGATDDFKTRALIMATRAIDRLNFLGEIAEVGQVLQFPRYADDSIPTDIIRATCELALALLDDVDPEIEMENLNMTSQGHGSVRSTYDTSQPPEHILAGIVSVTAWRYLRP